MDFYYNRDYYMMRGHWEQSEPLVFALEQEDQNQQTMHQQATVEQPSTSEANIVDYAQHQHAPEQHEEQQFALPLNNPPPTQNTTNTTTTTTTPGCVATKQENYDSGVSPGTSPDRQSPSTNTSTAPNSRRSSVEEAANAVKQDNVVIKQEKIDYNDCNENNADIVEIMSEQLTCPVCAFTSENRLTFSEHLQIHCPKTSDSQEFTNSVMDQLSNGDAANNPEDDRYAESPVSNHEEHPEKEDAVKEPGLRVPRVNSQGKVKTFKCKQCNYVTITKIDFWEHTRVHIKPEKVLTCPKCPFITEYKHHLEYHIRNHVGSKPYTCNECSYTCVNKSMLNSHLKSHSAVYQFRCADCVYSTKYCHSLKLHLRKYRHNPAMVLNPDGTPNPYPIIDVYGTRRGPKPKPKKTNDTNNIGQPQPSTSNVPATVTSSTLANNIMSTMMTQAGPSTSTQATTVPTPTAVAPIINSFQFNPVMNGLKNMGNVNAFNTFNGAVNPNGMVLPAANGLVAGFPFFSGFPFTNPFRFNANNLNLPMGQHFMNNAAEPMMSSEFVNGNFNAEAANTSMTTETAEEAYDLRVVTPPNIRKIGEPEVTSAPLDLTKLQQNHQMTDNTQQINNVDHDFTHDNNTSSSIISNNNNDTITANNNFSNNIHEVMNLAQAAANPTNTPPKNMKNRRKGKAVKLENGFYQYNDSDENMQLESQDSPMQQCPVSPSPERIEVKTPTASPTSQAPLNSTTSATKTGKLSPENNEYHCTFCDLRFGNHVMYVVHMGLHDSIEPFKCNMCGTHCKDEVYFHLHMLEKPHY